MKTGNQETQVSHLIQAWKAIQPQDKTLNLLQLKTFEILSGGTPVSAKHLAKESHIPLEQVELIFQMAQKGASEFDEEGNLVGSALTLNKTPHEFIIKGNHLYTWCSLDAIFLPGLIKESATVKSKCPVTGAPVELQITPEGIESVSPESAVLTVIDPGVAMECGTKLEGPEGAICTSMHFFKDQNAAAEYIGNRKDLCILSPAEAYELAKNVWITPLKGAGQA